MSAQLGGLVVFLALIGLAGCGPDREEVVRQKVAERITAFRSKKNQECRASLLREAGQMADSILLEEARRGLRDSLGRMRPFRPYKPPPLPPIDTSPVKPLFNKQ